MTKNMEDLLWRGDSLDRKYCEAAPPESNGMLTKNLLLSLRDVDDVVFLAR